MSNQLKIQLARRILILDGAMATMIQQHELSEHDFRNTALQSHSIALKGNNDLLNLTRPDLIKEIHGQYLKAGADVICTNTFNANSISQADYQTQDRVDEINYQGVQLARQAVDELTRIDASRTCFVAGSIGPTTRMASLSPDVNNPAFRAITFDELVVCFKQQAKVLIEAGADLLLLETFIDTLNAKAALFALMALFDELGHTLPIMVSGTVTDASGRLLSGQTVEAFLVSISHAPLLSVGLNCALGADQLRPYIEILAKEAPFYVSTHPNAGLPNEFGGYDQTPEEIAQRLEEFAQQGWLNLVGGCCGTTPDHIRAIAQAVSKYPPRRVRPSRTYQYTKSSVPIVDTHTLQLDTKRIGDASFSPRKGQPTPQSTQQPSYSLAEITKTIAQIDNSLTLAELINLFVEEKALYHPEQAMLINAHLWGRTQFLRSQPAVV